MHWMRFRYVYMNLCRHISLHLCIFSYIILYDPQSLYHIYIYGIYRYRYHLLTRPMWICFLCPANLLWAPQFRSAFC